MVRLTKLQLLAALEAAAIEAPPNPTHAELLEIFNSNNLPTPLPKTPLKTLPTTLPISLPTDDEIPIANNETPQSANSETLQSANSETLQSANSENSLTHESQTAEQDDEELVRLMRQRRILSLRAEVRQLEWADHETKAAKEQNLTSVISNTRYRNSVATIHIQGGSGWRILKMSLEHLSSTKEHVTCVHVVC